MKKAVIIIIVLLLLLPILPLLIPKALTIERIQTDLEAKGFSVGNVEEIGSPGLDAAKQWYMTVNGAPADVYFYTDVGKIAKQYEYQKKDVGTAVVEAWNLSESLGAAPSRNTPSFPARNGMFMIVVTTPNKDLGKRVAAAFKKL